MSDTWIPPDEPGLEEPWVSPVDLLFFSFGGALIKLAKKVMLRSAFGAGTRAAGVAAVEKAAEKSVARFLDPALRDFSGFVHHEGYALKAVARKVGSTYEVVIYNIQRRLPPGPSQLSKLWARCEQEASKEGAKTLRIILDDVRNPKFMSPSNFTHEGFSYVRKLVRMPTVAENGGLGWMTKTNVYMKKVVQ